MTMMLYSCDRRSSLCCVLTRTRAKQNKGLLCVPLTLAYNTYTASQPDRIKKNEKGTRGFRNERDEQSHRPFYFKLCNAPSTVMKSRANSCTNAIPNETEESSRCRRNNTNIFHHVPPPTRIRKVSPSSPWFEPPAI